MSVPLSKEVNWSASDDLKRYVAIATEVVIATLLGNSKVADRQLWSRVISSLFRPPKGELPGIAEAAFDVLDHWCQTSTSEKDTVASPAIDGAFSVIGQFVITSPDSAHATCRRVGSYFTRRNINVSFTAVRRFVYPVFCRYTIYVSNLLIQLASSNDLPRLPSR